MEAVVQAYLSVFTEEFVSLQALGRQAEKGMDVFSRKNFDGHVTASALVLNADMDKALLIHHKGLNKWLQPGGHIEDDASLWAAALREVAEETGIANVRPHMWHERHGGIPFDIDTHGIPARPQKGEPEHQHHDCLFIAVASADAVISPQPEEVTGAEWKPLDHIKNDPRLARVYRKAKVCNII